MPEVSNLKKHECTGCGACWNICPHECIKCEYDQEGFIYPQFTTDCMECGLCSKVCPMLTGKVSCRPEIEQYAIAAVSNDPHTCHMSTSGGAFSEISRAFGGRESAVFGARFDGLSVLHSYVIGVDNISPFHKSKYVQSYTGNTFFQAKTFLEKGRKVIYSGTPCQIAGLRSFLGKVYENLLTIDFICHGVGSPGVFNAALRYNEKKAGKKLISYSFRNQTIRFGNRRDYVSCYEFDDGQRAYECNDSYKSLFLSQLCLRPSCSSNCRFRHANRVSDITIADFKNKFKVFPLMLDNRNYSTVIPNTSKGDSVVQKLNKTMKILKCDMSHIMKHNSLFFQTSPGNEKREQFFQYFCEGVCYEDLTKEFVLPCRPWVKYAWLRDYLVPFYLRRFCEIFIYLGSTLFTKTKTVFSIRH